MKTLKYSNVMNYWEAGAATLSNDNTYHLGDLSECHNCVSVLPSVAVCQ